MTRSKPLWSEVWPAVTSVRIGRPHPFARRWILVVQPPLECPIPCRGVPPCASRMLVRPDDGAIDHLQAVGRGIELGRALVERLKDRLPSPASVHRRNCLKRSTTCRTPRASPARGSPSGRSRTRRRALPGGRLPAARCAPAHSGGTARRTPTPRPTSAPAPSPSPRPITVGQRASRQASQRKGFVNTA